MQDVFHKCLESMLLLPRPVCHTGSAASGLGGASSWLLDCRMSLAFKGKAGLLRRAFFVRGALVFVGVTTGALTWQGCGGSSEATVKSVASFGWEVANLNGSGANACFEVMRRMVLSSVEVDLAFMITASPPAPGFAAVLCQAGVSRSGAPALTSSPGPDYLPVTASPDFGGVTVHNPNGLQIVNNPNLVRDVFHSVILKA
jgi:hypothetical protein